MKCQVCGGKLHSEVSDMPFKLGPRRIVIVKDLQVLQCENCGEYVIENAVMQSVERILGTVDSTAELEIVQYAA